MQPPTNPVLWTASLFAARGALLLTVLTAVAGILLGNTAPSWMAPLFFAGVSFTIVFYAAVFMMELAAPAKSIIALLMLSGVLVSVMPLVGFLPKPVFIAAGPFLVVLGLALAGSLILSCSVLITDSNQTRSNL